MNTKIMSEKLGLQTSGEMPEPQQDALGESQDVWSARQWWLIQIVFWLGFSAITFLTLTVWYATVEMSHVLHTLLQGLLGLILCWPLSRIFLSLGDLELSQRIPLCLFAVAAVALLWTLLRMETFIAITDARGLWADFGGWYFGAIFVFLCWSGMHFGLYYYQLLQRERLKVLAARAHSIQADALAKESQLKMLRYQLNPHFLFNTLNALSSLMQQGDKVGGQLMLTRLSDFLRYSLDSDPLEMVPLKVETAMLETYLGIEQMRFSDRMRVDVQIDSAAEDVLVPSLLLQPLAENAIKHAIAPSENGGTFSVCADVQADRLILEVGDSGPGIHQAEASHGIGLRNIRQRLETLYGQDFELSYGTAEEDYVVKIVIPVRGATEF